MTCYDAQYDDSNSHLLLAYVDITHFAPPEALPMPLVYNEMIVDALADLHSQFWDHPRLQEDIGALATDIPTFTIEKASQNFAVFIDHLGDRLSARRRGYYEKIMASFPQYQPTAPATLVHGDAHWWNFLYPHDHTTQRLYLIDWAV